MTAPLLPPSLTHTWSPEQKLAVYDLCRVISESLWQDHRDALIDAMIRDDRERGFELEGYVYEQNLELPFDDDLPF